MRKLPLFLKNQKRNIVEPGSGLQLENPPSAWVVAPPPYCQPHPSLKNKKMTSKKIGSWLVWPKQEMQAERDLCFVVARAGTAVFIPGVNSVWVLSFVPTDSRCYYGGTSCDICCV